MDSKDRSRPKTEKDGKDSGKARTSGSKGKIITIELVAFAFLAVYLIGYTTSMLNKPKIGIEAVTPGQIDVPRQYDGIVLRDETVTFSSNQGTVIFSYGENEYVKKGSVVCSVRSDASLDELEREIENINDNIIGRQEAPNGDSSKTEEIRRIDSKIKTELNNAVPLFMQNDAGEVYRFKNQLQKDIDARNGMYLTEPEASVSELLDKRTAYERRLLDGTDTYAAPQGGVLSYDVDGLESVFTSEKIMDVTIEQAGTAAVRELTAERQVTAGSPLFKTVHSNVWYICTYLENEVALDWKEGTSKILYFTGIDSVERLSMRIEAIEQREGKTYVVFSSSKYLLDFINKRNVKFSLEDDSYKGLKLPNSSITLKTSLLVPKDYIFEVRGSSGVYIKENDGFYFRNVNVLSYNDGIAYILQSFDGVKLGTAVYLYRDGRVVEDSGCIIEDIKTVEGVYVANSGTAEFRQVNVIKKNDYYSIAEIGQGTGIKSFDRIVTDASAVNDNQIIR